MKKTFNLTSPNKEPERQVDSVVHEIRKYIKRERKKPLPENVIIGTLIAVSVMMLIVPQSLN